MNVHRSSTIEQLSKPQRAYREHGGQTYRGRQRVATAHPIPKPEDVLSFDPEVVSELLGGADCGEMRTDRAVAKVVNNPGSGVLGVDHRLGSGECLRRDDEQSLLGRHVTEHIDDVCGVDIGDEMTGDLRIAVGTQRLIRHRWTEV